MNHSAHLTDEQFADCSLGAPDAACAAHLAGCAQCRGELNAFAIATSDFSRTAMAWSQSQPMASLRAVTAGRRSPAMHPAMQWAVAGAVLLAAGVPVVLHGDHAPAMGGNAPVTAMGPEDSPAQIEKDDQLMQSVTMVLRAPEPAMLAEYGLQTDESGARRAPQSRIQ